MSSNLDLQPAYVLHSRPYRETSLLVDIFTRDHGVVPTVAKGIRGKKGTRRAILQPFRRIRCSWRGKGDLVSLIKFESEDLGYDYAKQVLFSGFYLNELLMRLLHRHDPHELLFDAYGKVLNDFQLPENLEVCLREFEFLLLNELGYGIDFSSDIDERPIQSEALYRLIAQQRFMQIGDAQPADENTFLGHELMAIAEHDWQQKDILKQAKRLTRLSLSPLLGDKPLQSRALFRSYQR